MSDVAEQAISSPRVRDIQIFRLKSSSENTVLAVLLQLIELPNQRSQWEQYPILDLELNQGIWRSQ